MRKILKSNKFWIILFGSIATISILALFFASLNTGTEVQIYYKDKLIDTMDLSKNKTKQIKLDEGYNIIEVKDGSVFVKSADCKNQICVNSGKKSSVGSAIICAPHRLTIKITGEPSADADT